VIHFLVANLQRSCIIEFDGASKGNPGQSGAGVVLRAVNGNVVGLEFQCLHNFILLTILLLYNV